MAESTKYLKVDTNVLLEWTFNDAELITENYHILSNLQYPYREFMSNTITNVNNINNTALLLDPTVNKYTQANPGNYNFLQLQNFNTSLIPYDDIKLYFPISFSFVDFGYTGLIIKIYAYDYYNENYYIFSQYFFDEQDSSRRNEIQLGTPFFYDENQWSKYIEFQIPSIDFISKQRTTDNNGNNLPTLNTINNDLTNGIGISDTTPIFIEFSFINTSQTIFGIKYFYTNPPYSTSISKTADYLGLAVNIQESTQADWFEIQGSYAGSTENLDDYINYLTSIGKNVTIQYQVNLYEENILTNSQTYLVTNNFAQTILYRPCITFSNTTAYIQVVMSVTDLVSETTQTYMASIGLTNNLFKYGPKLISVNVAESYIPKIYNTNDTPFMVNGVNNIPNLLTTKVNFPLLVDTFNILVGSSNASNSSYYGMGLLEIILNPYDNLLKFKIAQDIDSNGNVTPYDITTLLNNATITLNFTSSSNSIVENIYFASDQNDYVNGTLIFIVNQNDMTTISTIYTDNNRFYLTVNDTNTNNNTLLYYGTFQLLQNIIPLGNGSSSNNGTNSTGNQTTTGTNPSVTTTTNAAGNSTTAGSTPTQASNAAPVLPEVVNLLLFILPTTNKVNFETSLGQVVNFTTQVHTDYNFTYFIIGLTYKQIASIETLPGVDKYVTVPINIGQVTTISTTELNTVTALVNQANSIDQSWITTVATYVASTGTLSGPPTAAEYATLLSEVTSIIQSLNSYGYKLDQNTQSGPNQPIWILAPDDGNGSWIPGYGYKIV